ncbi:MAG: right-handed parallel beta-helix repeat-containing protein [Phycisphaerales bacterium]|nr:right-handed parallel beta-helix repeat-containing protein [Phycisphaerales bacterium]
MWKNRAKTGLLQLGTTGSAALLFLMVASAQGQTTWHVDATLATGSDNGTSWADAFQGSGGLQDALAVAQPNDEIWVAQGTYIPGALRTDTFQLLNNVEIYAGFPNGGGDGTFGARNSDPATNGTMLSGDLAGNDQPNFVNNGENSYHVVTGSGTDSTAILDGFTIIGGNANETMTEPHFFGAGLQNWVPAGNPTIRRCRFQENRAAAGAGIHIGIGSNPTITNCSFLGNIASTEGGGIYINGSSPTISDCFFNANSTDGPIGGGGIFIINGINPTITNCTFLLNVANSGALGGAIRSSNSNWTVAQSFFCNNIATTGGAIQSDGGITNITNCLFVDNRSSPGNGAGVSAQNSNQANLTNCTFTLNIADTDGGGMFVDGSSNAAVRNCIFWNNTDSGPTDETAQILNSAGPATSVDYSDIHGGWSGTGGNNINADPLFVDVPQDDFHLVINSPCRDAGNNALVPGGVTTDLDGNPRISSPCTMPPDTVDMGAYEVQFGNPQPILYVDANASGANDGTSWADAYTDLQNALCSAAMALSVVDEIRVATGTYTPDLGKGDRNASFELLESIEIKGGYRGLAGGGSPDDRDDFTDLDNPLFETILSGEIGDTGTDSDNAVHVVTSGLTSASVNNTAVLDGFTITGGRATIPSGGSASEDGAGILIINSSPIFRHLRLLSNEAMDDAGAFLVNGGSPVVEDSLFDGNTCADRGGAVFCLTTSTPRFERCEFRNNQSTDDNGGAFYCGQGGGSDPVIVQCRFTNNEAGQGGAIYLTDGSSASIDNCIVIENTGINAAGIEITGGASAEIQNTMFVANRTTPGVGQRDGGAIRCVGGGTLSVKESVFVDNSSDDFGGAISSSPPADLDIQNTRFIGNNAGNAGGGLSIGDLAVVANCLFGGNTGNSGSGIFAGGNSNAELANLTIVANGARGANAGAGIQFSGASTKNLANSILWDNTDDINGTPDADQTAQILDGVSATVQYCDIQDDDPDDGTIPFSGFPGNIDDAPLFVAGPIGTWTVDSTYDPVTGQSTLFDDNASYPADALAGRLINMNTSQHRQSLIISNTTTQIIVWGDFTSEGTMGAQYQINDYHLQVPSPCIDAGSNLAVPPDTADLDGDMDFGEPTPLDLDLLARFADEAFTADTGIGPPPIVDMGAFEVPATLFVDAGANGLNNGSNWDDAFVHLQDALAAASDQPGTRIWVAAGVYRPDRSNANPTGSGDCEATFQLLNSVTLLGGFAGGETDPDLRDPETNTTTLSGDLAGNDGPNFSNNNENSFHVVTGSSTDPTAVIDGFTITGGNANVSGDNRESGGGMINVSGSPAVMNCTFRGNSAQTNGGGMFNFLGSPTVSACTFEENRATRGGAVNNVIDSASSFLDCRFVGNTAVGTMPRGGAMHNQNDSNVTIANCIFLNNTATGDNSIGGGVNNSNSTPVIINCRFFGNSANFGGGLGCFMSNPLVANCIFSGNTASGGPSNSGGAIFLIGDNNPMLLNCVLANNASATGNTSGGGIDSSLGGTPVLSNCILWGNTANGFGDEAAQINGAPDVNYSLIQGLTGSLGGVGNIGGDPLFVDTDGVDDIIGTEDDDLRLQSGSPAIDAGDNTSLPADTFDLDNDSNTTESIPIDLAGKPRFFDDPATADTGNGTPPIVDIGTFEFMADCNNNGTPDEDDIAAMTSDDCNVNDIPDECEVPPNATLSVWTAAGDGTSWNDPLNWCPQIVPNNGSPPGTTYVVLIDLVAQFPELDISPMLDDLDIGNGAGVMATQGDATLSVASGGTIDNAGLINATNGSMLTLSGDVVQTGSGSISAADSMTTIRIAPGSSVTGGTLDVASNAAILLDDSIAVNTNLIGTGGGNIQAVNDGTLVEPTVQVLEIPDMNFGFIEGVVTNDGLIQVNSTANSTGLRPTLMALMVDLASSGAGDLALQENPSNPLSRAILGDPFTDLLNNSGHRIRGVGELHASQILNQGEIVAEAVGNRTLDLLAGFTESTNTITVEDGAELGTFGDVQIRQNLSVFEVDGNAKVMIPGELELTDQGVYSAVTTPSAPLTASLLAGSVGINCSGLMYLTEGMTANVLGAIVMNEASEPFALQFGCTPPILRVTGSSLVQASMLDMTGGLLQIEDDGIVDIDGTVIVNEGATVENMGVTTGSLRAKTLSILNDGASGQVTIGSTADVMIDGDTMDNAVSVVGCSGTLLGCTPPILRLIESTSIDVNGSFSISGSATIEVETATFNLSGDFDNRSTDSTLFDWSLGFLTLDGTNQAFELAGVDRGVSPTGFDDNFAMDTLRVESGATVDFANGFDNSPGSVCEVLYVRTLSLGTGSTIILNGCNIYYESLDDQGAVIDDALGGALVCLIPGDLNCDGTADFNDMNIFIAVLLGMDTEASHIAASDLDGDGEANGDDIQDFVDSTLMSN